MDPLSILSSVFTIVDKILKFVSPTVEQFPAQSELCEYQANLQKLRPVLASLPKDLTWDPAHKFLYIAIILRNSESTAQRLYDLFPSCCDGDGKQGDVEELVPCIKMMSAALNQLRLELYQQCPKESATILSVGPNVKYPPCGESRPLNESPSSNLIEHDWVFPTLEDCSPDAELASVDRLIEEHADTRSTLSHVAKVVGKIRFYWSRDRRKRGLHNEVKLATFDTPQEYIDCAAWILEQARSTSTCIAGRTHLRRQIRPCSPRRRRSSAQEIPPIDERPRSLEDVFPEHRGQRYFSIRAACCVRASFRPLTAKELFFAATTKISPKDHEWPFATDNKESSIAELMQICDKFLRVDDGGLVYFRDEYSHVFRGQEGPVSHKDAHLFMSLVCLRHMKREPRLILKPWLDYHKLEAEEKHFPLHKYVVSFWQSHCRAAEGASTRVPNEMDVVIQAAWLSERGARCLRASDCASKELDALLVQGEALDVGLEVSIAHGFSELARSYRKMGAKPAEEDTFDLRDWVLVEPLSTCGPEPRESNS